MAPLSSRDQALAAYPDFPLLAPDPASAKVTMRAAGYLKADERVERIGKAGEGNMNLTLRVGLSSGRSVILKQSRPWVEKYDAIAAPFDRAITEARFYEVARRIPGVAERMPALLGSDAATRTLLLEDLGEASDLTGVYRGERLSREEIEAAAHYLQALHAGTTTSAMAGEGEAYAMAFRNAEMRSLNHAHIFHVPLTDHGFVDLDGLEPGLGPTAAELRKDKAFVSEVTRLGEVYLADNGEVLLHGDYFPGSLLRTGEGLKVIDPEFCFLGPAAWDVGVFVAHLALAGAPKTSAQAFLDAYGGPFDAALMGQFAGVETMRRLIGVAQLPLGHTDGQRARLLKRSREALLGRDWTRLWGDGS